jgi:hypothetical protein
MNAGSTGYGMRPMTEQCLVSSKHMGASSQQPMPCVATVPREDRGPAKTDPDAVPTTPGPDGTSVRRAAESPSHSSILAAIAMPVQNLTPAPKLAPNPTLTPALAPMFACSTSREIILRRRVVVTSSIVVATASTTLNSLHANAAR